jgi:hypothetical protein
MLNTFIKNRGTTKTIVHNNNRNYISEINWDADYDGNKANISVDSISNGRRSHIDEQLDNDDLASILNIPSVNMPLEKRILKDLKYTHNSPRMIEIHNAPMIEQEREQFKLSSPLPDEELLIPLTIDKKTMKSFGLSSGVKSKKRHRTRKHHTYHRHRRYNRTARKHNKRIHRHYKKHKI